MLQIFTYARKGAALRSLVSMMLAMLMADVVSVFVTALLVPGDWKAVVAVAGVLLVAFSIWVFTWPLRTAHALDERELRLQMGRFRAVICRGTITAATLCLEPLPRGIEIPSRPCAYDPDTETLYLLADKRGLVAVWPFPP